MNGAENDAFGSELLDDFYAECDEHLSNIRSQLLAVEQAAMAGGFDRAALDSCFRSMHSLKGNAAIVGLHSAEQLAHSAEDLLRRILKAGRITPEMVHAFAGSTQRLEQIVSAHRLKQPLPVVADSIKALQASAGIDQAPAPATDAGAESSPPSPAHLLADLRQRGLHAWRCIFSPSAELDRRGVNINSVRARLAGLGEIASATPSIAKGGSMRFEFLLGLREDPTQVESWARDGMSLERIEPEHLEAIPSQAVPRPTGPEVIPSGFFISPSHIVRVDLSRLDDLMRITGEMVIHRSRLEERIARTSGDRSSLQEVNLSLARSLRELREALTRVRLVSVAEIFTRMPFVVRDLTSDGEKRVRLVVEGQHTEIDKYLVERLKEPLLHLVRNAVSHGIEPAAERAAAGKPEQGILVLRAEAVGHSVMIQIRDDGRGIDRGAVVARAAEAGIPVPETLDDNELLDLLCRPGFSTRDEADRTAGRGVGMAVVQSTIREMGGTLGVESTPRHGTQFTIRLPLTLSIAETFIVSVADHSCAVPQEFVREVLTLPAGGVTVINGAEVIPYMQGVLPLIRLRDLFGAGPSESSQPPTLVLETERGLLGLVVDRVLGRREVVVRALHDALIQAPGVSGATELGDGRPVLILDPGALAARQFRTAARTNLPNITPPVPAVLH